MHALEQLLRDTAWNNVDVMVVDLPPGTGDAQLSISQRVPLSGTQLLLFCLNVVFTCLLFFF